MARKPNHAWEKRQRELAKQAKRAAKLQRRQAAKDEKAAQEQGYEGGDADSSAPDGADPAHG